MKQGINPRNYKLTGLGILFAQTAFNPHRDTPKQCKHCASTRIISRRKNNMHWFECVNCESWLGDVPSRIGHSRYHRLFDNKAYQAFQKESAIVFGEMQSIEANCLLSDAAIEICYLYHGEKAPESIQGSIKKLKARIVLRDGNINFDAITFLEVFHPQAMHLYWNPK